MNSSLLKFAVRGTAAVLVVAAAIVPRAHGQTDERPVTNAFAVSGATVQTEPGKVLRNATVVVRDGIITAVGTDVAIPYDARILDDQGHGRDADRDAHTRRCDRRVHDR